MFEKLITAPEVEPVTVEEQCQFSRIDVPGTDDGASPPGPNLDRVEIQGFISAAREQVEQIAKVAMISQVWLLTFDSFPDKEDFYNNITQRLYYPYVVPLIPPSHREDAIELLRRPVLEATTDSPPVVPVVSYIDPTGEEQTFDASNYVVFADKITLLPGKCWPNSASMTDSVRITYPAGYGDDPSSVPARLKKAVKFLAGWWFEERLPVGTQPTSEVLMTLTSIINPFKTFRIPR